MNVIANKELLQQLIERRKKTVFNQKFSSQETPIETLEGPESSVDLMLFSAENQNI